MDIHFRTRSLCRTASAVLLAWLFAVAAGVATACLLETPAVGAVASKVAVLEPSHPHALAGHAEESDFAKKSCLESCVGGTQVLPKAQVGADQSDPGPAPLFGPPLRIRYSRLAL